MSLPDKYTKPAVILHWLIAIGIIFNLGMMLIVGDDDRNRAFYDLHKSVGLVVLGFALMRLLWRFSHKPPALPTTYKPWESKLSHAAHFALYGLMIAMPLSGWLHDSAWKDAASHPLTIFGVIPWFRLLPFTTMDLASKEHWHGIFGFWHAIILTYVLYAVLLAHIAGALKHQFLDKEKELQRMWF